MNKRSGSESSSSNHEGEESLSSSPSERYVSVDPQLQSWQDVYGSESQFRLKFNQIIQSSQLLLGEHQSTPRTPLKNHLKGRRLLEVEALQKAADAGCLRFLTLDNEPVCFYDDRPLVKAMKSLLKGTLIEIKGSPKKVQEPNWGEGLNNLVTSMRVLQGEGREIRQIIDSSTLRSMGKSLEGNSDKPTQQTQEKLVLMQKKMKALVQKIKKLEDQIGVQKDAIGHAVSRNVDQEQKHSSALSLAKRERDRAISDVREISEELHSKDGEIEQLQAAVKNLQSKLRTAHRELKALGDVEENKTKLSLLNDAVEEVRTRYERLGDQLKENYESELAHYKEDTQRRLEVESAVLRQALEEERQKRSESEELKKLREMYRQLQSKNTALEAENKKLDTQVTVLGQLLDKGGQDRIQELQEEVSRLKEEAEGAGDNKPIRRKLLMEGFGEEEVSSVNSADVVVHEKEYD